MEVEESEAKGCVHEILYSLCMYKRLVPQPITVGSAEFLYLAADECREGIMYMCSTISNVHRSVNKMVISFSGSSLNCVHTSK